MEVGSVPLIQRAFWFASSIAISEWPVVLHSCDPEKTSKAETFSFIETSYQGVSNKT